MENIFNIASFIASIILGISTAIVIIENIRKKDGKIHIWWSKATFILMMILLLLSLAQDGAIALQKLLN